MAAPIMADAQDLVSTFDVLGHASYRTVQELRFPFDCLVRFTVCPPLSLYSAAGLAIGTNTTFFSIPIRFRGDDHAGTLKIPLFTALSVNHSLALTFTSSLALFPQAECWPLGREPKPPA